MALRILSQPNTQVTQPQTGKPRVLSGTQPAPQQDIITQIPGLPGAERVQKLQAARTPAVTAVQEELRATPKTQRELVLKAPTLALKGLAVPFEAIESGLSRGISKLQEPMPKSGTSGMLREAIGEGVKGFTGAITGKEKPYEFGDLIRRLSETGGMGNEAAARIWGLTTMGVITDPLVGKTFSKTLGYLDDLGKDVLGVNVSAKRALGKTPQEAIIPKAQKLIQSTDEMVSESGKRIAELFKGERGIVDMGQTKINRMVKMLPKSAQDALKSPDARSIFKIKLNPDGTVKSTAKNIWRLRQFLDDIPTQGEFIKGAGSAARGAVMRTADVLRGMISGLGDDVAKAMQSHSNIVTKRNIIRGKMLDPNGMVKDSVKNILNSTQARMIFREMADDISQLAPDVAELARTVGTIARRRAIGKGLKAMGRIGAGVGLLRGAFRGLGGGGEVESVGGGG